MSLVKSFPNWPIAVVDALAAKRGETAHGCGSCIHAVYASPVDNSPGSKAAVEFSLGACGAGVQLERGGRGLRASTFCTSWNVTLGSPRVGGSDVSGAGLDKPRHRPLQGPGTPSVTCSPSLSPLFR